MNRLQGIESFVRVAQLRSFSAAAKQLGVAKSVVSSRIQQLEEEVGMLLLLRNTRVVTLSEAGQAFYDECEPLVTRANEAVDRARELSGTPSGLLRVHVLPGFALGFFGGMVGRFQEQYPGITLDLVISDTIVDPVREGYDCTLQIFEPVSDSLVARRLVPWRGVFCAAPIYLAQHDIPKQPADLREHRLGLYSGYPTRDYWAFRNGTYQEKLQLHANLRTNSVHLLREYACGGYGIAYIPTCVASADLLSGNLKVVLPAHEMPIFWLSAVFAASQRGRLNLRLFLDALAVDSSQDPPWDRELFDRGLITRSRTVLRDAKPDT